MPTTPSAAEIFSRFDDLPPDCAALVAAAQGSFFTTPAWWRTVLQSGLPPGATPRFVLVRDAGRPAALFPLQITGGAWESLTTPYTCLYRPLLAPGLDTAALHQVGKTLGRWCPAPTLRLDALAQDTPGLAPLLAGLRQAGLWAARFDHFGNWYEPVAGLSWAQYLQTRRGELRETVRRKLRRADGVTHDIVTGPDGLDAGIADYEAIYASSWKTAEPFPRFNADMMRAAADLGVLRLGLLRAQGRAVAAQIWIVMNGTAAVLKLAHDEAARSLSPGTVLTALMIRDLLDHEHVAELDFGRGDDPYKQLWTGRRRQRIGIELINPLHPAGLVRLARHVLGRARRRLLRRKTSA